MSEARSRYPGTRPFSDSPGDVMRFFGRDAEAEELYLRVLSVPLLVQFGNSGLGKTSLLQAGLFPRLRQKPFLPVMIRLNNAEESLTAAVTRSIRESCESEGIEATHRSTEGLWELLSSTTVWRDDLLLTPVLVFDQFEEVFTLRDAAFRAEIAAELGALASGIAPARATGTRRPDVKVVISLREDYLGALEEFSAAIPGLFQERLRLGPLTEEAARDAIAGPAQLVASDTSPPFELDPAALEMMLAELKGKSGVIEPFQLQLLARHAETVAARKGAGARLTPDDFRGTQDFESVLKNFYRDTLHHITPRSQRAKARRLAEEGLLGASGHRLMLEERQIRSDYGVTTETLQTLEASRLMRRERRLESVFYEISHDRIADSIFHGRSARLPRRLKQALWVAAGLALVVVAGLLVFNWRMARERDTVERWLAVLLGEEFFGELRDSGRSTVARRLQNQIAMDSQAGMGSAVTRGLALRNHGDLQRLDATLPEALASFRAALTELQAAPRNIATLREIARTERRIGETLGQQGQLPGALRHHDASVAAWRDAVQQKSQAVNDDCLGLAESLAAAADMNVRAGRNAVALRHSDEAFEIAFRMSFDTADRCGGRKGPLEPDPDVPSLHVLALLALVQHEIAPDLQALDGAVTLTARARELRPPSLEASGLALTTLILRGRARSASAEEYRGILEDLRSIKRWDADNRAGQHDRAGTRLLIADSLLQCAKSERGCSPALLDDMEITADETTAILRTLSATDPTDVSLHRDLLWALRTHGILLAARGKDSASASMKLFDEAERLHASRAGDFADPRYADEFARLLGDKAVTLARLGDVPGALATFRRAEALLVKAIQDHPERQSPRSILYADRLWVAQLQERAGNPAAAAASRSAAEELRRWFETRRVNAAKLSVPASTFAAHRQTAEVLLSKNDPAAALRELLASESTLRAALRRHPTYADYYIQLVETCDLLRQAYAKLGRPEDELYTLAAATTAAQLARWLVPPHRRAEMNENLLWMRGELSSAMLAQNRPAEARKVLEDVASLGEEFLAEPTPDGWALGVIGDAKCRIATIERGLGQAGWHDTLDAGLLYLRKAAALDPEEQPKLRQCQAHATESATQTR